VTIGVRPENLEVHRTERGIEAEVLLVEELGSDAFVHAGVQQGGDEVVLVARVDPRHPPAKGERVRLAPSGGGVHAFDSASGERLTA
jgi:multiple sugar transport system ATP-binding protein